LVGCVVKQRRLLSRSKQPSRITLAVETNLKHIMETEAVILDKTTIHLIACVSLFLLDTELLHLFRGETWNME
jgi:hypothetical protein